MRTIRFRYLFMHLVMSILGAILAAPAARAVTDVEFAPAENRPEVLRLIKKLYPDKDWWSCPQETCRTGLEVLYAFADFNDDGRNELVVVFDSNLHCGTAGCSADIFERRNGRWRLLCGTMSDGSIRLLDVRENGYRWFISARQELHRWDLNHACWVASFMYDVAPEHWYRFFEK